MNKEQLAEMLAPLYDRMDAADARVVEGVSKRYAEALADSHRKFRVNIATELIAARVGAGERGPITSEDCRQALAAADLLLAEAGK